MLSAEEDPVARDDEIRDRLEGRLAQLLARTGKIESDRRKLPDRDWQERATELENEEVLEQLGDTERAEIQEIRGALSRLDAGSYGVCQACDRPIQPKRLEALPFAKTCIDCAEAEGEAPR